MSIIHVESEDITNSINVGKAIPEKTCIEQCVWLSRHMDGCSDLMQRDAITDLILVRSNKRKRSKSYKPVFPVKEVVTISKVKIPKYVGFSCKHYHMRACLRCWRSDALRMFK